MQANDFRRGNEHKSYNPELSSMTHSEYPHGKSVFHHDPEYSKILEASHEDSHWQESKQEEESKYGYRDYGGIREDDEEDSDVDYEDESDEYGRYDDDASAQMINKYMDKTPAFVVAGKG